jgi:hypothetical protein
VQCTSFIAPYASYARSFTSPAEQFVRARRSKNYNQSFTLKQERFGWEKLRSKIDENGFFYSVNVELRGCAGLYQRSPS